MEPSKERPGRDGKKSGTPAGIDEQIMWRWCAWQSRFGIARDLGLTEGQVRSRASLMGLPARDRTKLVPDFVEGRPYDQSLEASVMQRSSTRLCRAGNR